MGRARLGQGFRSDKAAARRAGRLSRRACGAQAACGAGALHESSVRVVHRREGMWPPTGLTRGPDGARGGGVGRGVGNRLAPLTGG